MPVYTVHAPISHNADIAATDRFAFVRDGFHVWALLAAPLWLACHRLWLALIGWIVVVVAIDAAMTALHAGRMMIFLANVLLALLMGLEAAALDPVAAQLAPARHRGGRRRGAGRAALFRPLDRETAFARQ
jgi:hypothetical protein